MSMLAARHVLCLPGKSSNCGDMHHFHSQASGFDSVLDLQENLNEPVELGYQLSIDNEKFVLD